jgi:hypothetical protein
MDLARLIGIIIVFGAPAIIGGGLVYHLLHSWLAVWLYEALLILVAVTTRALRDGCESSDIGSSHSSVVAARKTSTSNPNRKRAHSFHCGMSPFLFYGYAKSNNPDYVPNSSFTVMATL